jgi:hypothetical protein
MTVLGEPANSVQRLANALGEVIRERDRLHAENTRLKEQQEAALILLRRYEYLRPDAKPLPLIHCVCPCCGWPEGGHDGPGRYKGNAENTHEEGCSLDAVLHGRPAPRLASIPASESDE